MEGTKPKLTIATHNGKFHPDDIFGVATLWLVLEKDHEIEVIRTRDREKIDAADYAVDVGDSYDPDNNRFDHHQTAGAGVRPNGIPYASFGVVWKKYGKIVAGSKEVADKIEQKLVVCLDALDNGVEISKPIFPDVHPYAIYDVFFAYETTWKEDPKELDGRFLYLMTLAKEILKREIINLKDREEAKEEVVRLYSEAKDKNLIVFDRFYPWHDVLSGYMDTRLVIYPKLTDNHWVIEVVRDKEFENTRISLPESWAGQRDEILSDITGVKGSVFCHKDRYLAVAKTKESAIELAHLALKEAGR